MAPKVVTEDALKTLINKLTPQYQIFGPKKKKNEHTFEIVTPEELDLNYGTTILPPKKLVIPQRENFLELKPDGKVTLQTPSFEKKRMIFGIHPCDLNGLLFLDKVFLDLFPSEIYRIRRKNLVTVALGCREVLDTCFCSSLGTGPSIEDGFDVLLTPIEGGFLIEAGSCEGEEIVGKVDGRIATDKDLLSKKRSIEETKRKFKRSIDTDGLPELFEKNINHDLWRRLGEADLACAQCIMSCPTCYCFDVRDSLSIDLQTCSRYREWDACFLLEFSEVALGGNFRRDRAARVRQFMGHNLGWGGASQYPSSLNRFKCVGCGRCIRTCPVHIDITEVVAELRGERRERSL
ncbi:MAG: 4Fe-4S dicluster domain-containing protein [Candidatus Bathyarchaeia archaeon]